MRRQQAQKQGAGPKSGIQQATAQDPWLGRGEQTGQTRRTLEEAFLSLSLSQEGGVDIVVLSREGILSFLYTLC